MQFKPITALAVLLLVVASLLVAGCTSTSNPSPIGTPSATYTPTSSNNGNTASNGVLGKLTQALESQGAIIVTPFAYSVDVNGHKTYTGVIKDGSKKLEVYNRTRTYTLFDNRSEMRTAFSQAKNTATSQGYSGLSDYDTWWIGYQNRDENIGKVGTKEAVITICEPDGYCGYDYTVKFGEKFVVTTEYRTRLE